MRADTERKVRAMHAARQEGKNWAQIALTPGTSFASGNCAKLAYLAGCPRLNITPIETPRHLVHPPELRAAVAAYVAGTALEGTTYGSIAKDFNISRNTVASLAFRIKHKRKAQ